MQFAGLSQFTWIVRQMARYNRVGVLWLAKGQLKLALPLEMVWQEMLLWLTEYQLNKDVLEL